jgi:hypothetical protein
LINNHYESMAGTGGRREGAGRKLGVPNKFSADLKAMILGALDDAGGQRYLARQAIENPGPFMALLGKILPTQVASADGSPIEMHLLAAKVISAQILERRSAPQPQTIQHEPLPASLLDASVPTE